MAPPHNNHNNNNTEDGAARHHGQTRKGQAPSEVRNAVTTNAVNHPPQGESNTMASSHHGPTLHSFFEQRATKSSYFSKPPTAQQQQQRQPSPTPAATAGSRFPLALQRQAHSAATLDRNTRPSSSPASPAGTMATHPSVPGKSLVVPQLWMV